VLLSCESCWPDNGKDLFIRNLNVALPAASLLFGPEAEPIFNSILGSFYLLTYMANQLQKSAPKTIFTRRKIVKLCSFVCQAQAL